MKRFLILHPVLFAIYPVIALLSFNFDQVQLREVYRSLLIILASAVGILLVLKLIVKDWDRAGLLCSLVFVLFFTYGHVFRFVRGKSLAGILIGRTDYLAALWAAILIVVAWWILRQLDDAGKVTKFLNIVAIAAVVLPGSRVISFTLQNIGDADVSVLQADTSNASKLAVQGQLPDIYYIIVDGYGGADVLEEIYSYDNSEFLLRLTDRGFYVASNSHSNYGQTFLSLSSSLNYCYIDELNSRDQAIELIHNSRVRAFLSDQGYQLVTFASGYSLTEIDNADLCIAPSLRLNGFELMLLKHSAAVFWFPHVILTGQRNVILNTLETLAHMPDTGSPKFVFAHIVAPHPPFMFGPNGEAIEPKSFSLADGSHYEGSRDEYIDGYRGQLIYLNQLLENAIAGILTNSETEPIIILQADHGPGAFLDWESAENSCYKERLSILNAYYLPDNGAQQLYDSITPVNSFRVVFDTYFGTNLGLLEDEVYFSLFNSPDDFINVTDQLNTCVVNP